MGIKFLISLVVFLGIISIVFAFPDCTDTDDTDIYTQGTCTDSCGGPYTDYCVSDERGVMEYYCSGSTCDLASFECPNGECCSDGKCNGVAGTCSDTDGVDPNTAGSCTDSCGGPYTDYCFDDKTAVVEYHCSANKHCISTGIFCPPGTCCVDGKCVAGGTGTCSDSDGGKDIYTQGTCTDSCGGPYTDYCNLYKTGVWEYYCLGFPFLGNICTYDYFECPNGECCSDGKCNGVAGTCSDTDGVDPNTAGSCTDSCSGTFNDHCTSDKTAVVEYFCNAKKHCASTEISCPPGTCCSGGECNPAACACVPGETKSCGNCGTQTCQADGTWGPCVADATKCTGNCAICSTTDGGATYNCAGDNTLCSNTPDSCFCSGSGTSFNCQSCPSSGCCDATCSAYTCGLSPNDANCPAGQTCGADCTCSATCNNNGICEVYNPDIGENQTGCSNDCYTRAKIIPSENLLPGAEVKVIVYFNDSRWYDSRFKTPGRDASLNLTIDGREWTECVVHKKRWKDIGWPGDRETWSTVYQGKSVLITSTLGYARLEANCTLPSWLGSGSHLLVAIPTIYSKPTLLAPSTVNFTVKAPKLSVLDLFTQFIKSILLLNFL